MSIQLPDDLELFVEQRVTCGAYASEGDVIRAAFTLLEERERLVQHIEAGFEQIRSGQYTDYFSDSLPVFLARIRAKSDEIRNAAGAR